MGIEVSWLAAVNSFEPGELFQQLYVTIIYLTNFLFEVTWKGYICLKWSTINGSCLRETSPLLIILLFLWLGEGGTKQKQLQNYGSVYLTHNFVWVPQPPICNYNVVRVVRVVNVDETCIDGQWFSKVIQLRTVIRPVYVLLGIQNDPEGEVNAKFTHISLFSV